MKAVSARLWARKDQSALAVYMTNGRAAEVCKTSGFPCDVMPLMPHDVRSSLDAVGDACLVQAEPIERASWFSMADAWLNGEI
ncbi:hypothetical protein VTN00DRAFT_935 [Thermoascus crustaceus]|uniref:uncharacterized protein n=1 Tax=Thermoascus crustaceus TaxID=5088 RepID=UPI003743396C